MSWLGVSEVPTGGERNGQVGDEKTSHNSTILQSDLTSVKLEPYSNNTLMNVDSENSDSRLISFKDGFNFEENYQEWSSNVSKRFGPCNRDFMFLLWLNSDSVCD